jgi:periplasmic protein TonB
MKYFIIIIALYVTCFDIVSAQNGLNYPSNSNQVSPFDSVRYFNSNWKQTTKDSCAYYKLFMQKDGKYVIEQYKSSGVIIERGEYSSIDPEVKSGHFVTFYANGTLLSKFEMTDNKINGEYKEFSSDGKLNKIIQYKDDHIMENTYESSEDTDEGISELNNEESDTLDPRTDKLPEFPGGDKSFQKFIEKNIYYPLDADEVEGTVLISFVIEVDGSVSEIKIVKSAHPSFSAEAIRVIKKMPKWIPGEKKGEKVRVIIEIPIVFSIQSFD